jgi:hypothetical protein
VDLLLHGDGVERLDQNHAPQDAHPDTKGIALWQQEISVGFPGRHADREEQGADLEDDTHDDMKDAFEKTTMVSGTQHGITLGESTYWPEEFKELLIRILTDIRLDEVFDAELGTFHNCTSGAEITESIVKHLGATSTSDADKIGRDLMDNGFLRRIVKTNASHYQWTAKSFELAGLPGYHPSESSVVSSGTAIESRTSGESYHETKITSVEKSIQYLRLTDGVLTDAELMTVANSLQFLGNAKWAKVPRLYLVLRSIDQLDVLDDFIDQGKSTYLGEMRNIAYVTPTQS